MPHDSLMPICAWNGDLGYSRQCVATGSDEFCDIDQCPLLTLLEAISLNRQRLFQFPMSTAFSSSKVFVLGRLIAFRHGPTPTANTIHCKVTSRPTLRTAFHFLTYSWWLLPCEHCHIIQCKMFFVHLHCRKLSCCDIWFGWALLLHIILVHIGGESEV